MTHKGRQHLKLESLGQMAASIPAVRELREYAAESLGHGATDEEARALLITEMRAKLIGPRLALPWLTRKVARMGVREFLRALADEMALRLRGKCVGDVADGLWSRIGVEDAIADWLLAWAKDPKGEPGAIGDVFAGRTWTGRLGFGKNTAECVFVVITPLSDPQELLRQAYEECHRVLPDGTWSRYGANVEAHRLLRLKYENDPCSWGDVAEIVLDEREPHLRSMGADVFAEAKEIERKRIEKLIARFWNEYGDSFHAELSPDSD